MQDIYVGNLQQAQFLRSSLNNHFTDQTCPEIIVVPTNEKVEEARVSFIPVRPPTPDLSRYVLTQHRLEGVRVCFSDILTQRAAQPTQEIVIEAEVVATAQSGLIMQDLAVERWVLTGWLPSPRLLGGICLVMTRSDNRQAQG